jgi:pyridoxal phosphate phosphatase PHOSPHO2
MSSNKILLIFDFDETIMDKDSVYEIARMTLSNEDYIKIMEIDNEDYYDAFNYFFKKLKEIGLDLIKYNKYLKKLELSPKMNELFDYIKKNKSKYDLLILSGDIIYSIQYILKYHGYLDLFSYFICNKADIQEENSERIIYVPRDQFPHNCDLCIASQCKGLELEKFLKDKKYEKIFFVCDGGNDFCPAKKIMKKADIVFPREGHRFLKRIKIENLKDELKCEIVPWKTGEDIINRLKQI